jgi:hypothetical protein
MTQANIDIESFTGTDLHDYQKILVSTIAAGGMKPGEMMVMSAGRQTGKSMLNAMYGKMWNSIFMDQPAQIQWQKLPGKKIKAFTDGNSPRGLRDSDMDEVQKWLWTNIPSAKRLSFDMWLFKEDKHITMFLMRWTS